MSRVGREGEPMRKLVRILKISAATLALAVLALSIYVTTTWNRVWDAPLPQVHASADPEVIRRGEYLVYGPAHCVECHASSPEAVERYIDTGERPPLTGGQRFAAPPLGAIYSKNITPDAETGIGRYSDAQVARMLRFAVRP